MTPAYVAGIGLRGPGLSGWAESRMVLRREQQRDLAPTVVPMPALLAPNERRRAGLVTRLGLAVAEEAVTHAGLPLDAVRGVFGSANGDGQTVLALLETLAQPGRPVSPTQFHNSVHNAVAGYWSIAAGSAQPVTCLGGFSATFGIVLMKAAAEVAAERAPVLLCVYDAPLPAPLARYAPMEASFAVALVLLPEPPAVCFGTIQIAYAAEETSLAESAPHGPGLRDLAQANPAAMSLRLLEALASGEPDRFPLPMIDGRITVTVGPCS